MSRGVPWRRRHPRIETPLPLALARWSLTRIVLAYVVLSVVLAMSLAVVLRGVRSDGPALPEALRTSFAAVWTGGAGLLERDGEPVAYYLVAAVMTVTGVLLPLFLLGSFVFKLFHRDPLVWRSVVSVEDHERGPVLAFRYYNGLNSPVVNITTVVLARFQTSQKPNLRANRRLRVLSRGEVHDSSYWAYGAPGVPFTFRVPLQAHASADEVCEARVLTFEDRSTERRHLEFVVTATGTFTATGGTFVSTKVYSASSDLLPGRFTDIDVDEDVAPKKWAGWDRFEQNCDLYVFAYGSLLNRESLATTLQRSLSPSSGPHAAVLRGWRRAWNVGADISTHPTRRYVASDGQSFQGVVASLGLVRAQDEWCTGAVFGVSPHDLTLLDSRERNYDRVDVTEAIDLYSSCRPGRVYTYVPKDESVARLAGALAEGRAVVRAQYWELSERALSELAVPAEWRRGLPAPPCPVIPFDLVDLASAPAGQVDGSSRS